MGTVSLMLLMQVKSSIDVSIEILACDSADVRMLCERLLSPERMPVCVQRTASHVKVVGDRTVFWVGQRALQLLRSSLHRVLAL